MKKKIIELLKDYNPEEIRFFRGDGNSVNWDMYITCKGSKKYICYGYFVGDPTGRQKVIDFINQEVQQNFKYS